MEDQPILLPIPRIFNHLGGLYTLSDKHLLLLNARIPQAILFSALRLQEAIFTYLHVRMGINASQGILPKNVGIILRLDPQLNIKPQGYQLNITSAGILIQATDGAGIFYACCTLIQLIEYYTSERGKTNNLPDCSLPCVKINDWPDFLHRGVMIDISRDKVPTMETAYNLIDLLASWKINQLQLYTEHTFAYPQHPEVWAEASPFTGEDVLRLDAFCRERYIELVPNQNSFGHLESWLKLPRYKALAETPNGFDFPWRHHQGPFSLCPIDPQSLVFLKSLYDELLPHFSSRQFNVGCDETFDLGQGRSKAECERRGTGRVYLDFVLKIYDEVKKRGFTMQFWGDIVMAHPDLVDELPKDIIALEWGYEATHPFKEHGEQFMRAGLPFYVCPGTSSWNSIAGRTDNCIGNLANAAENGIKYGAEGYLITDWGDDGHWQTLPISYLGFAAGAAYSWSFQSNIDLQIQEALNRYAFIDLSGHIGNLAYELGNIYQEVGIELDNASMLFHILQNPIAEWKNYIEPGAAIQSSQKTLNKLNLLAKNLTNFSLLRADNELLQREFGMTIELLRHACMRGAYGFGSRAYSPKILSEDLENIIAEYQTIWLSRNRPGGLKDSLAYFDIAKNEYHQKLETL